jgi:hypothetical protein
MYGCLSLRIIFRYEAYLSTWESACGIKIWENYKS